ncbi:cytochrome P450 [Stigmatella aurantiaca]|uniref:cytochrome P450 n=1 Tax=Stigmatella aurantiaca TaxID=41 RepID=UPI001160CEFE
MPRSPWGPHRDPRGFADPDALRPERWLGGSLEGLPKFASLPLGGARLCMGPRWRLDRPPSRNYLVC